MGTKAPEKGVFYRPDFSLAVNIFLFIFVDTWERPEEREHPTTFKHDVRYPTDDGENVLCLNVKRHREAEGEGGGAAAQTCR